ncbi:MAG: hypothetical protein HY701_04940 [Gemmatimonadetes bacterium]|nr:hypothetical protein [Gemmatimonadota bacterium]
MQLKPTIIGLLVGAGLFALASLYRSATAGAGLFAHLQPVAFMTVIGGTVGGLAGPLVGAIVQRLIGKRGGRE